MTPGHEFEEALEKIKNPAHRERLEQVITWVESNYPNLGKRIAWQQPLFTDHGTFIVGLKPSQKHLTINPEVAGIEHFAEAIDQAGYARQKMTFSIAWDKEVNFDLIRAIIDWQITEKANTSTFWR